MDTSGLCLRSGSGVLGSWGGDMVRRILNAHMRVGQL